MVFNSIKRFVSDVQELTRKPKDNCSSVQKDINEALTGLSFDTVYGLNTCIRHVNKSRVIKTRIKNSAAKVGSSGGFRLIFIANPNNQVITFLHVFSKQGRFRKDNISESELKTILEELLEEAKSTALISADFMTQKEMVTTNKNL